MVIEQHGRDTLAIYSKGRSSFFVGNRGSRSFLVGNLRGYDLLCDDDLFCKATLLRYPYVDMTIIRKGNEERIP